MSVQFRAPDFNQPGLEWLNTDGDLTMAQLKGRVVLVYFWSYCCVRSRQFFPVLHDIAERNGEALLIVGVHTPKFNGEKDPEHVLQAISRYHILFPVIHDPNYLLWRQYSMQAWPSLAVVGLAGFIAARKQGEPNPKRLERFLRQQMDNPGGSGNLFPIKAISPPKPRGRFAFPTSVKKLSQGGKFAVCNNGSHTIHILGEDGTTKSIIGSGKPALQDGPFAEASFRNPVGLAVRDDHLFIADSGNHAIRRADLKRSTVETIAGTGKERRLLKEKKPARATDLSSVSHLELDGDRLYFANTGSHQLGVFNLETDEIELLAGSGQESMADGKALQAHFVQPAGLRFYEPDQVLFVAESASSSIRSVKLTPGKTIRTITGKGAYSFGDQTGRFEDALFQYVFDLELIGNKIFVTDSLNGRIKVMDLGSGSVADLSELGFEAVPPVTYPLNGEPTGICSIDSDSLLITETNQHRILKLDLDKRTLGIWTS